MGISGLQSLIAAYLDALDAKMSPLGWVRPDRDEDHFDGPLQGELVPQFSALGSTDEGTGHVHFYPAIGIQYPEAVDLEGRFLGQPEGARGNYGIPYIERFTSVDALISEMASTGWAAQDVTRKLAIMYALSGRRAEALDALAVFAGRFPEQSGMLADQTYRFVMAFAGHFGFGGDLLPDQARLSRGDEVEFVVTGARHYGVLIETVTGERGWIEGEYLPGQTRAGTVAAGW